MAVITETPVWVDDIYEIQRADPVLGGTHNISNLQGESLANRTAYLKKEQDSIKTDLYTDRKFAHLDEDGRIPYSELPESAMEYKGLIDPVLTPNKLQDGTGDNGDLYLVKNDGTLNFSQTRSVEVSKNDRVIYNGSTEEWEVIGAGSGNIRILGDWNASTNTPHLEDGQTGYKNGDMYAVSVGGNIDLGSGQQSFSKGDFCLYTGSQWLKFGGGMSQILYDDSPIGHIAFCANEEIPQGYIPCLGQQVSKSQFPDLYAAIGDRFGAPSDDTLFTLPSPALIGGIVYEEMYLSEYSTQIKSEYSSDIDAQPSYVHFMPYSGILGFGETGSADNNALPSVVMRFNGKDFSLILKEGTSLNMMTPFLKKNTIVSSGNTKNTSFKHYVSRIRLLAFDNSKEIPVIKYQSSLNLLDLYSTSIKLSPTDSTTVYDKLTELDSRTGSSIAISDTDATSIEEAVAAAASSGGSSMGGATFIIDSQSKFEQLCDCVLEKTVGDDTITYDYSHTLIKAGIYYESDAHNAGTSDIWKYCSVLEGEPGVVNKLADNYDPTSETVEGGKPTILLRNAWSGISTTSITITNGIYDITVQSLQGYYNGTPKTSNTINNVTLIAQMYGANGTDEHEKNRFNFLLNSINVVNNFTLKRCEIIYTHGGTYQINDFSVSSGVVESCICYECYAFGDYNYDTSVSGITSKFLALYRNSVLHYCGGQYSEPLSYMRTGGWLSFCYACEIYGRAHFTQESYVSIGYIGFVCYRECNFGAALVTVPRYFTSVFDDCVGSVRLFFENSSWNLVGRVRTTDTIHFALNCNMSILSGDTFQISVSANLFWMFYHCEGSYNFGNVHIYCTSLTGVMILRNCVGVNMWMFLAIRANSAIANNGSFCYMYDCVNCLCRFTILDYSMSSQTFNYIGRVSINTYGGTIQIINGTSNAMTIYNSSVPEAANSGHLLLFTSGSITVNS